VKRQRHAERDDQERGHQAQPSAHRAHPAMHVYRAIDDAFDTARINSMSAVSPSRRSAGVAKPPADIMKMPGPAASINRVPFHRWIQARSGRVL
jgi:hypothetical protein